MSNRQVRRAFLAKARKRDPWEWDDRSDNAQRAPNQHSWGRCTGVWVSPLYVVLVYTRETAWGEVTHLAIRRCDEKPEIPWRDMQRIKSELVGPERLGFEVFPPESAVMDQANMYHLWVLPEGFVVPFGLAGGLRG